MLAEIGSDIAKSASNAILKMEALINPSTPTLYDRAITLVERYGLLLVFASSFALLAPNLSPKAALMDADVHASAAAGASSNIVKQLVWSGLFAAYFVCMTRETALFNPLKRRWSLVIILIASTLILFASTLWSDFKFLTIKRTIFQLFLMFDVFCAIYFACKHKTFETNVRILALLITALTTIAIAIGAGFSDLGLASYMGTKNSFGAAVLSFFAIYICIKPKRVDIYIIPPLVLFLLLSISKTSIALFLVMMLFSKLHIIFSKLFFSLTAYITTALFLVIPVAAAYMDILWFPSQDKDPSFMTGRGLIWQILYPDILMKPEVSYGHGYGAYFGTGTIPDVMNVKDSFLSHLNQSHNSYLDLGLQIGFPLTIVLMALLISLVRRTNLKQLYLAGAVLFIYGISEAAIYRDQQGVWITFLVVLSWSLIKLSNDEEHQQTVESPRNYP